MTDRRLLTRIVLRNYRSVAACDVRPAQLSFLVGPNGSGKSNFLDALRFVADSLDRSVDRALRERGGIGEVRRRSGGRPNRFGIRLEFNLAEWRGHHAFAVGAKPGRGCEIQAEECFVSRQDGGDPQHYRVERGRVRRSSFSLAPVAAERLYLAAVSELDAFRAVREALSGISCHDLDPSAIRDLHAPDPGAPLKRDGGNAASVLSDLAARSPESRERIEAYLGKMVPGVVGVDRRSIGPGETPEFRQEVRGARHPWRFPAANMSDGTLRALGVLVASFQGFGAGEGERRLVGIEEPGRGLHPAAVGVLVDGLRDAAERTQILVTTHSPDLLDDDGIAADSILAVVAENGETRMGSLDEAATGAIERRLYTAGELLRMDQLGPDPGAFGPEAGPFNPFGRGAGGGS